MENPEKEITLKIGQNSYKVKFPDTGTLIELEQRKASIKFSNLGTDSAIWAYNLAIAIETFRMLVPDLEKDMNVKDFDRLDLMESRVLVKVYLEQFKPWFQSWINLVTSVFDEKDESKAND